MAMLRRSLRPSLGAALVAVASIATPAAAERFQPASMDGNVEAHLPEGAVVTRRIDHDLDGDGLTDVVVLSEAEDDRRVIVLRAFNNEAEAGFELPDQLELDPVPVDGTALRVERKVLVVEEITGGTVHAEVRWRFRWDATLGAMRLIGDDLRSPATAARSAVSVSTNRLTGRQVWTIDGATREARVDAAPIRMADVPDPFEVLAGSP